MNPAFPTADSATPAPAEPNLVEAALVVLTHPRFLALVPMYPDVPGHRWRCDLVPENGQGTSFLADTPLEACARAMPELVKQAGDGLQ